MVCGFSSPWLLVSKPRLVLRALRFHLRDVFSSGPADMSRTDLVTHTIDTGEHRPIRLSLRRLPITTQEVERAEIQKMLDRGVIEPCQSSWASPVAWLQRKMALHSSV